MQKPGRVKAIKSTPFKPRQRSYQGRLPVYILVFLIALMPLPWGSIFHWSWLPLGLAVFLVAFATLPFQLSAGRLGVLSQPVLVAAVTLYTLAVVWVFLQAQAIWPTSWLADLEIVLPDFIPADNLNTISISPEDSTLGGVRLMVYAAVFLIVVTTARARANAGFLLWSLIIIGAVYALYGIIEGLTEFEIIESGRRTSAAIAGTYVNRNMFAAYVGMNLLCAVAMATELVSRHMQHAGRLRVAIVDLLSARSAAGWFVVVCILVNIAALLLTASRGGMVGVFAATAVFVLLVRASNMPISPALKNRRTMLIVTAALLVFGILVFILAGQYVVDRVGDRALAGDVGRLSLYGVVASLLAERPLSGFGLGTFVKIYYLYSDHFADAGLTRIYEYAHNLYLDLAIELGIPFAVILLAATALMAFSCFRGVKRRRRDQFYPALAVAVTAQVAIHGLVDFPLLLPAVAATFASIIGVGVAQAFPTSRDATNNA